MLNGSDTPDLESSASDRHSDASELPFADSQPAQQQGPHPMGSGYAAAAAAGSSVCPPSGPSRTASIRSSAASTEDVFSPRTGQGPTPPLASALSSSSGVSSSHGGYGLVHKHLPTTRPAALAEAPPSAPDGPVEGTAGGAQGRGLAGEPSHDCLQDWAQGGGLQTRHSAEGLPSLSRQVMSPDPAGEFWRRACFLSSVWWVGVFHPTTTTSTALTLSQSWHISRITAPCLSCGAHSPVWQRSVLMQVRV